MKRLSDQSALIVIDLQTAMFAGDLFEPLHQADRLADRVRSLLAWARRTGRPVCFIRHDGDSGDSLAPGASGWPIWPALGQAEHEPTFSKTVGDAFSQAALVDWVGQNQLAEVILLGAQSDQCVAATVKGALERGLAVTVVADAHSTWDSEGESAEHIITRYNALFANSGAHLASTEDVIRS
ncbi:MAG: isochorismatase family protein [Burkholderiaceae bacterium]|jgi:nicotinamidase-related amidase